MLDYKSWKVLASAAILSVGLGTAAQALPALQLGPGPEAGWAYDTVTDTWVLATGNGTVNAFANDDGTGASGAYAWDTAGSSAQIAYLVVAAMPASTLADGDVFDITVSNDGGNLAMYTSGYGTPPVEDPNSIPGHSIFDTYFEIYEFNFDGAMTTIENQEPPGGDAADGFVEAFSITVNGYSAGTTGIHFDLFTVQGDGSLVLLSSSRQTVKKFAPPSHDAEFGCCGERVPEPGPLGLLGAGMIALYIARRRRLAS